MCFSRVRTIIKRRGPFLRVHVTQKKTLSSELANDSIESRTCRINTQPKIVFCSFDDKGPAYYKKTLKSYLKFLFA